MNKISALFGIQHPIIQAGMVWCSGWRLASAVSNAGGLGLIGAGSMHPDLLREHVRKCKIATTQPFGVNIPLLYPEIEKIIEVVLHEGVPIIFTSAGNPALWTPILKEHGRIVVHVVSSVRFAKKAEQSGVDAVVAEGFEAGGHNGREETTTFVLLPMVRDAITVPLIAAGGIASGRAMLAARILGADGVQVGSRFAVSEESSAHALYKEKVLSSSEGDTVLTLKNVTPVRLLRNNFYSSVKQAEERGATLEELVTLLGKRRAKRGIFEGDLEEGELEIGQISATLNRIEPAASIVEDMWKEYEDLKQRYCHELS